MHEPRKHPRISESELSHILKGGAMVDIDSAQEFERSSGGFLENDARAAHEPNAMVRLHWAVLRYCIELFLHHMVSHFISFKRAA